MDENRQKTVKKYTDHLNKQPVSCDQCHRANNLHNFMDIFYSDHVARNLESFDAGLMISGHEIFNLPEVIDQ